MIIYTLEGARPFQRQTRNEHPGDRSLCQGCLQIVGAATLYTGKLPLRLGMHLKL